MDAEVSYKPADLKIEACMATLATPEMIVNVCDALIADLQQLCADAKKYGSDKVVSAYRAHTYPLRQYVSEGGWSDRKEWYHGWYIAIGLNHQEPSLGFMTEPVVKALRERFTKEHKAMHTPETRSVETVTGPVFIHQNYFKTPSGIYAISHTHSSHVERMID